MKKDFQFSSVSETIEICEYVKIIGNKWNKLEIKYDPWPLGYFGVYGCLQQTNHITELLTIDWLKHVNAASTYIICTELLIHHLAR